MMRIFDQTKTTQLEAPDLTRGYLQRDRRLAAHHEAQEETVQQSHYELLREFGNGGKEYREVIDVPYRAAQEAWDEYEEIWVYIPYTEEEAAKIAADALRGRREAECFPVVNRGQLWYDKLSQEQRAEVNRGQLWYDKLSQEQRAELSAWYEAWLNAPQSGTAPEALPWIDSVK